jgi:chemotaxis protein methyltransferase CheR
MISLADDEFLAIAEYIRSHYGVNLEKKKALIEGRLGFHLLSMGFRSYREYFEYAKTDGGQREMANLVNRLTTNHTYFLREEEHFTWFEDHVLPWIDQELRTRDPRIWSAGCSTGQEPYTLSIVLLNYLGIRAADWDTTILATDISDNSLLMAQKGIYPDEDLVHLPLNWREKYFERQGQGFQKVTETLRKNVAFKQYNLLSPFSQRKPFHTIFCRNVMIYFAAETKTKLVQKFYDALVPGGYLFIGHSESLATLQHSFQYVSPSVYRKGQEIPRYNSFQKSLAGHPTATDS